MAKSKLDQFIEENELKIVRDGKAVCLKAAKSDKDIEYFRKHAKDILAKLKEKK